MRYAALCVACAIDGDLFTVWRCMARCSSGALVGVRQGHGHDVASIDTRAIAHIGTRVHDLNVL